mmetsp:Transcript_18336/g.26646  ORF Transcript_18336/g.26646 Transcript_18336/m.26646 type:complete len:90 (+) Transcript_18336:2442-2711(+)
MVPVSCIRQQPKRSLRLHGVEAFHPNRDHEFALWEGKDVDEESKVGSVPLRSWKGPKELVNGRKKAERAVIGPQRRVKCLERLTRSKTR